MKKALSLVLALVLVLGMSTMAFAATKIEYDGSTVPIIWYDPDVKTAGSTLVDAETGWGLEKPYNTYPEKVEFFLDPAAFSIVDGAGSPDNITTSMLSSSSIKVRVDATSKEKAILKSVELKQRKLSSGGTADADFLAAGAPFHNNTANNAYIELKFVEDFVSVSDVDYDFEIKLTHKGVVFATIPVSGTFEVDKETVEEGQDEADSSEGIVLEPDVLVRNIEVYGGENFYAKVNLASNKKYYFVAKTGIEDEDIQVTEKYPEISMIYYIDQVNMKFGGNNYYFKDLGEEFFVYNAEGRLIGTSNDELPFSEKYYLATKKIEMGGDPEPSESAPEEPSGDAPADTETPPSGGADIEGGTGYNPNTGL